MQKSIFSQILNQDTLHSIIRGSTARSLALINLLTKISNSPFLLKQATEKNSEAEGVNESYVKKALSLLPENAQAEDVSLSGIFVFYFVA